MDSQLTVGKARESKHWSKQRLGQNCNFLKISKFIPFLMFSYVLEDSKWTLFAFILETEKARGLQMENRASVHVLAELHLGSPCLLTVVLPCI